MLIPRLLRSILRFLSPGIVPDGDGGAPAADPTPSAPVPDAGAAPAPSEPADQFAGVRAAIDSIGKDPAAEPAPTGGQPRDPLGRFAPVGPNAQPTPPAPTPAPVAPPTPDPKAAQQPAAPKPGEVDLTPPEGMSERAQARWQQLTERVKQVPELERRATEATQALDSVRQLVNDSGLAPNEFTEMLDMARLFKSGDAKALQMLDGLRADLATRLGVDVPGVDPLAAHADLKQKVDSMLLSREDALEIARLRQGSQQLQAVTAEQRELQQFQQTVQGAASQLEQTLAARAGMPGHDAKVKYIAEHFSKPQNLQAFVRTYQPQQWEGVITMMYDAFTPQPAAMPQPQVPSTPQPLRPSSARAGAPVQTGPVTAQSALESAFSTIGL